MRTERQDNLGDAAGGDDGSFLSEFFLDAIQHTVDHRALPNMTPLLMQSMVFCQ